MRTLRLEKKGLRGLAIAESFRQNSKESILAGVVMRRDLVVDGFVFGKATVEGDDATDSILNMYRKINRPDVSYILISGLIISMYNIIELKKINQAIGIPVIGVTYEDSAGIAEAIKCHFPNSFASKVEKYQELGDRRKITLKSGYDVFVRAEGCNYTDVKHLLNDLTEQGAIPEPLRVAHLLANTVLKEF